MQITFRVVSHHLEDILPKCKLHQIAQNAFYPDTKPKLKVDTEPKLKVDTEPKLKVDTEPKLKVDTEPKLKLDECIQL